MGYLAQVMDQWKCFLEEKEVDPRVVPVEIINSWKRSREYGIDPWQTKPHPVDTSSQAYQNLQSLLKKYEFFFERVKEMIGRQDITLSLHTTEGLNYHLLCGKNTVYPGYIGECSEKTVGTTSTSLAMRHNQPILLYHPLTYCKEYSKNTGVAAPIHNDKNEVIGTLSLAFENPKEGNSFWSMISFITKAFDSLYLPLTKGYEKHMQQIFNCLPHGAAFLDHRDTVQFYNDKVLELLKINRKLNVEKELNKHLPKLGIGADIKAKGQMEYSCSRIQVDNEKPYKLILITDKLDGRKNLTLASDKEEQGLFSFDQIIGNSLLIKEAKKLAAKVARTSVPVMIHGESGTGKEMFAQAIHNSSSRCLGPFVAINCGALPSELVESELFGYEEGSFTGALKGGKIGKVEAASGGTLFLDEIESMPLKDQIKLLRVLSTGKVQRIGSNKEIKVDVRIVAATKVDLLKHADAGLFREDLFYRISTFIIELPALRHRGEDILELAEHFIAKFARKYGRGIIAMDPVFKDALQKYSWRGNVREMEHAMERAVIMLENENTLRLEHLSSNIQEGYKEKTVEKLVKEVVAHSTLCPGLLDLAERKVIEYVLELVDGNQSLAAQQLGINRRTLYTKLNRKRITGREILDA